MSELPKSTKKNVHQRIVSVMSDFKKLVKEGTNSFHNYKYVLEAQYTEELKPLLVKHGLTVSSNVAKMETKPFTDAKGKPQFLTELIMSFTISNADAPEEKVEFSIPSQGMDSGDKSVFKAITGAKKYFIALAFMVPSGNDAEDDEPENKPETNNPPARKTKGGFQAEETW